MVVFFPVTLDARHAAPQQKFDDADIIASPRALKRDEQGSVMR
jgi:hypothetical protein